MDKEQFNRQSLNGPISTLSPTSPSQEPKKIIRDNPAQIVLNDEGHAPKSEDPDPMPDVENNASLQKVLGPFINEFKLLHKSVNTVHAYYADINKTILKQKDEVKQGLSDKIDRNTTKLSSIAEENQNTQEGNDTLKDHLNRI